MKNKRQVDILVCKKAMFIVLLFSCVLENIFFFDENSVIVSITSLLSLFLFNKYVFQLQIIRNFPITFFVLSNLFLFMYLPIPVTLLDGNSVSHDMFNPSLTYFLQFIYYVTTISAFYFACKHKRKIAKRTRFLSKIGFFQELSIKQLWILGFLGCLPRLFLMISHTEIAVGFLSVLSYFMYAPIVILFRPLLGAVEADKKNKFFAVVYMVLIMLLLVGTNARHLLITPLIIVVGCFVVKYFQDEKRKSVLNLKNIIVTIVAFLVISGPFSDFATAMVLVRSLRSDIAFTELISETISVYQDKDALVLAKKMSIEDMGSGNLLTKEWSESYTSNVFLQRFCNYRVVDATIYHALRIGMPDKRMIKVTINQLEELPPSPIPQLLFGIDKYATHYSPLDYLYGYSTNTAPFAGLKVGGDVGLGLSVFGILYFIVQFIVYYMLFILLNSLTCRRNGMLVVSIFAIIQLMDIFNLMTVHSGLVRHIGFLIWSFWYNAILLIIITKIVKMFGGHRLTSEYQY